MKEEKIRILLVDQNPQTLKMVEEVLLRHSPDLDIETSVEGKNKTISFQYVPDIIVKNIRDRNGSGLRMSFVSCTSFSQQPISFLDTIIKIVRHATSNRERIK